MNRAQIIETMARAKCDWEGYEPDVVYPATGKPFWRCYESEAARDISTLEAAGLAVVPGHAMASGHMEESAGKALYEHFAFYPNEQKPAWTPAGNAIRQDDARRLAMAAVNAWLAAAQGAHKL
jgi:hypothetical protein